MHHIYHTEAFILGSRNTGEADRIFYLYTLDLGLIKARAQGVRKLSSKLRYLLQDFSRASIDLVRGKNSWRITSLSKAHAFPYIRKNSGSFAVVNNISRLITRLVHGEESHEKIFEDLSQAFFFLDRENTSEEEVRATELCLALRILHHLGYIGAADSVRPIIEETFSPSLIKYSSLDTKTIIFEINRALRESQL